MFSTNKRKPSLAEFILALNHGNKKILDALALNESKFTSLPYDHILENPSDIASGVVAVKMLSDNNIFNIFEDMLIKEYDNGDIRYILYTTTRNYDTINEIADTFHSILGEPFYEPDRHRSFKEKNKVLDLSKGLYQSEKDEIVDVWVLDDITLLLQYKIDPIFEFSLFITKLGVRKIDRTSRKKGTIANLFKNDISLIFSTTEDKKIEVFSDDNSIGAVKYYYLLDCKEFEVFDILEVQQHGSQKDYSLKKPTNLIFTSSTHISLINMVNVINRLVKMYGSDSDGVEELEIHELDLLEDKRSWSGRLWSFNEIHGIYNVNNINENRSYSVSITYDHLDSGFTLTIFLYNNLIEYFVPK